MEDFKYLSSTVQSNGECRRGVKKRVQTGWNGWRRKSGVICDRRVSARVKGKVYKVAARPAMGWRRIQKIGLTGDGKSAERTPDGKS